MTKANGSKSEPREPDSKESGSYAIDLKQLRFGRRGVLGGSIAALALAGCRDVTKGGGPKLTGGGTTSAPPPPTTAGAVGPGSSWTGAAGSGYAGSVPQDPVRTTAKPAVQWWIPSSQRMSSDMVIGVDADALGGVAYVDFYIEGSVQRVTQTRYDDADVNGKPRSRVGYWVTLSNAGFVAKNAAGAANIYAKATANDTTMQPRVIGPLVLYPRSAANDWVKTVAPSGADYQTLKAAIAAAAAANAEAPLVTITQTGFYELINGDPSAPYLGNKGFCTITAASGVTATLGRSAPFNPNDSASWEYWPGFEGIEYRGAGIVLDLKNWAYLKGRTAAPFWFNGCKLTNSIGTRDSLYWNKGPHPGFTISDYNGNLIRGYLTDATLEFIGGGLQDQLMVTGCQTYKLLAGLHDQTHFVADCYNYATDVSFFTNKINAASLTYAGSSSAATVSQDGANLVLSENGVAVRTYPLGGKPADRWFNISDIVNDINAYGNGWSASLIDNSRAAWSLCAVAGAANGPGFGPVNVKGVTQTLQSFIDFHTEWYHVWTGHGAPQENVIHRNNVVRASYFSTGFYYGEDLLQDAIIKGNVWEGTSSGGNSHICGNHVVFANNWHDGDWSTFGFADRYTTISQNVFRGVYTQASGGGWPSAPAFKDNAIAAGWQGMPAGANDSGNINLVDLATYLACYTNKAAGDFRPAGMIAGNLKPRLDPLDGRRNNRASNDAVGPWANGYTAPAYPF